MITRTMPAPEPFSAAAYAVIVVVPLLILVWYYFMLSNMGRKAFTGNERAGGT